MKRLYLCETCKVEKPWMDMTTEKQCKNCWIYAEYKRYTEGTTSGWRARRLKMGVKK